MKKALALVLGLILVLSVSLAGAETVLKLSEVHVDGYPTTLADLEFARLVEEKTEGRVKIEVYSNGSLYGEETGAIEAMQIGDLGFARVSASPVASYVPSLNAIQMPYLYKSADHMWAALDDAAVGQKMLDDIEASGSGLMGLCYYDSGCRSFYLTKEIHTPADMAGLKIRMQNNAMMVEMVELLGGTGVTGIGPNDIYQSIMTGVIDGAENNWPTYESKGDYQAATYYILDQHTRVPEILLGSVLALQEAGVSAEDIAIIKQCAKETQEFEKAEWHKKELASEEIVRGNGNTIIELTADERALFEAAVQPLYEKYAADYTDVVEAIRKIGEGF